MNILQAIFRARRSRQQLTTSLKLVREAQHLLDSSHLQVVRAQEKATRRNHEIPTGAQHIHDGDVDLIAAIDHWLYIRQQVQAPLQEAQKALADYSEDLYVLRSTRALLRRLVVKSARVTLPSEIAYAETAVAVVAKILNSRLTRLTLTALARRKPDPAAALARYRRNNAYFVAALEHVRDQLAPTAPQREITGNLPAEIAARVEATPLIAGSFTSILRRYQDFGARYAVNQQRVILGDEMGLGKTVQALAAMCHLHALGARNLLVIAPNSVLVNWERETRAHTALEPIVLHGSDRDERTFEWNNSGRVGITTFSTVSKIAHLIREVDILVVDEAHHVKNPTTHRTAAVAELAERSKHVILMTGTALENRLDELHSLASLAQPELKPVVDAALSVTYPDPDIVATLLAPVYLRRTQRDVLKELPERIHLDEWVDLSDDEFAGYLAVEPVLVLKRRAATRALASEMSAKYERLVELLDEHREAGHKIVVFSFFRNVIADVAHLAKTELIITGDSSPTERQQIIDEFDDAPAGAMLVSQIEAGGIGINLQMAQVVILMEPQLKPSTEWQAIARVHRMGQTRPVMVHRLLARHTVDEHLVNLIAQKEELFYAYAHDSAVKHESFMAVDTGDSRAAIQLQAMLDSGEIS